MIAIEKVNTSAYWPRAPIRAYPARRREAVSVGDVFCFLVPALQFLRFDLVGELSASDLLISAALPIALIRHRERLRQKPVLTILTLGVFWLVAQIVTDVVRNSSPEDYLRGWSKISLLLVNFAVVWIVACPCRRRFVLYGTGLGIGSILTFYLHPSSDAIVSPWKFALGVPVTLLVMMWVPYAAQNRYVGILLPAFALAIVHAFENVRGLALITFVTAVYSLFQMTAVRNQRLGRFRVAALTLVLACGVGGFTVVYSHYVEQGVFGDYAKRKLAAQESGEGGLLLGGRGEILASSQAILDSPLLGHGSWARDPKYAAILAEERADLGYKELYGKGGRRDDLIPSHSYIFGAWVEAGLAGALFWLFVLGYTIRTLLRVSGSEPIFPLFAFVGFMLAWDVLFSPLGNPTRFAAPYFMAAMVVLRSFRDWRPVWAEEI